MINTDLLAISTIFIGGFYLGFRLKEAFENLRNYFSKRREIEKN